MMIQMIGALLALVLLAVLVLLLRTFRTIRTSDGPTSEVTDFCHRPMQRLLDPTELQYLQNHGISKERLNKLRSERRRIYRLYLRSLTQDFNRVHTILNLLLICSYSDRPDLATRLAQQKFVFYRNLLLVEVRLSLHACGFEKIPEIDLLRPLEIIQAQLRELAPVTMPAVSAV
jgi:hypothetical protein